ncbi:MAG: sugar phosphate isomerase/epimerase [Candidatus Poribacteria bacterium]|nr:sugar phosphate isomerase/epimerase [Candidatus Poribacteria bacterium]
MKLGYSTWGMPTVPVDKAISHLANLGFDGIELTIIQRFTTELSTLDAAERKRIARLLKQHNLALPAIAAHSNLMDVDPESHKRNMWRLKGGVDLAIELAQGDELPAVNTTTGGKPDEWGTKKDFLVERVGELVDYAASRGVTIAMEPHIGAIIDTPDKVLELLEIINSPYLKVNFDISHFEIVGLSTEDTVSALADVSIHTHVKDQRGISPDFEFLIPGEGTFDYVNYLKLMQKQGYDGFITAEVSFMVQARKDYDPLAAATMTYETLSKAFVDAGIERN